MQVIDPDTSHNFEIAKVAAIVSVALAHFFDRSIMWVPAAIGLFIFGFSSGFFTSAKYHEKFRIGPFWRSKLLRLGPDLFLINGFLLLLFLVQGRGNIWSWATPAEMLGLHTLLGWLGASRHTPFGAGLWFFTVLLLFYAVYPAIRLIGRSRVMLCILTGVALITSVVLEQRVQMGYTLWMTSWSFIFGILAQRVNLSAPPWLTGISVAILVFVMVGLNVLFRFKLLNLYFIIAVSILTVMLLKNAKLPRKLFSPFRLISGCVMEMYFLHMYLFVRGTRNVALNLLISFALVIGISWLLAKVAVLLRKSLVTRFAFHGESLHALRPRSNS